MPRVFFVASDVIPLVFGLIVGFVAGFALCFWLFWSEHITVNKAPRVEILKP